MNTHSLAFNTQRLKIKTAEGFVDFEGIAQMGVKRIYEITFDDGSKIGTSSGHFFYTADGREIPVSEIEVGVELLGLTNRSVLSVEFVGEEQTYDIVNSETSTFFVNGLLSHNCQFISSDPLLIDTVVLANLTTALETTKPIGVAGEIVFYKQPTSGTTYLVGMDAATGSGNDCMAIQAFEFPSLEQVAEVRSNSMSSVTSYHLLKKLLKIFERTQSAVYYSVENNGVGEAIIALIEADENPLEHAEFVSESGQKRKGMATTGKTKIKACLTLKEMIERNAMQLKSKALIAELKQFVRSRGSYAAKSGATDDLVMATVIAIRLLEEIASYDQVAYDKLYAHAYTPTSPSASEYDEEDWGMGMTFG